MKQARPITVLWTSWHSSEVVSLLRRDNYVGTAFFPDSQDVLGGRSFSVDIHFVRPPLEQGNPTKGQAFFLSGEGPDGWLAPGTVFELLDGAQVVGIGLVH